MEYIEFSFVDAFTRKPFSGNPAAVSMPTQNLNDASMQNIASEINLSETAFLKKKGDIFQIRWFTPNGEVDLCGHATLASAHWLWETQATAADTITFRSKSGLLTANKAGEGKIKLDFPTEPALAVPGMTEKFLSILGAPPSYVGKNRMDFLIEIDSEETLLKIDPDMNAIRKLDCRGVIVTCRSTEFDFKSRCFYPKYGVNEDPVTGSAHCCLAPYWSEKLGKNNLKAFQASKRGGTISLVDQGNRVDLIGEAITTINARFAITVS